MTDFGQSNVLVVEDDPAFASALGVAIRRAGGTPRIVHSCARAQAALEVSPIRLVVLDIGLPDANGFELLRRLAAAGRPCPPVIVITAHGALGNAIEARKLGVVEFFDKPVHLGTFQATLCALLEAAEDAPRLSSDDPGTGAIPSRSWLAATCAERHPVLLEGETGTGKTRLARWLADQSSAASPARVVEEISRLSMAEQEALVRDCEEERGPRILGTTSDPPESLPPKLWYRLQRGHLRLPPLRDRVDELPERCDVILRGLRPGLRLGLAAEAADRLAAHAWPGNFRELENVLEGCCQRLGGRTRIEEGDLPDLRYPAAGESSLLPAEAVRRWLDDRLLDNPDVDYETLLRDWEGALLEDLLRRHGNKPSRLAAVRGLNRSTLRRRLRELGWGKGD